MNQDEKNYLKKTEKMRPSTLVFERMVEILTNVRSKTDKLQNTLESFLLKTFKSA